MYLTLCVADPFS